MGAVVVEAEISADRDVSAHNVPVFLTACAILDVADGVRDDGASKTYLHITVLVNVGNHETRFRRRVRAVHYRAEARTIHREIVRAVGEPDVEPAVRVRPHVVLAVARVRRRQPADPRLRVWRQSRDGHAVDGHVVGILRGRIDAAVHRVDGAAGDNARRRLRVLHPADVRTVVHGAAGVHRAAGNRNRAAVALVAAADARLPPLGVDDTAGNRDRAAITACSPADARAAVSGQRRDRSAADFDRPRVLAVAAADARPAPISAGRAGGGRERTLAADGRRRPFRHFERGTAGLETAVSVGGLEGV